MVKILHRSTVTMIGKDPCKTPRIANQTNVSPRKTHMTDLSHLVASHHSHRQAAPSSTRIGTAMEQPKLFSHRFSRQISAWQNCRTYLFHRRRIHRCRSFHLCLWREKLLRVLSEINRIWCSLTSRLIHWRRLSIAIWSMPSVRQSVASQNRV